METALLATSVKAVLLLAGSALVALLFRRSAAAARHQIWALGVLGVLALPLLGALLPSLLAVHAPVLASTRSRPLDAIVIGADGGAPATHHTPWLLIVWAAGASLVALSFVRSHLAARRILRDSIAGASGTGYRLSASISSPMTLGVRRPTIVLPVAAEAWCSERLRAVLMHELGHVQRRDILVQTLAQLACALYWWNPLAWLAAARLRVEREHACDDLVLAAGVLPSRYATDLLDVSRSVSVRVAEVGGACMVGTTEIESRLRRVLDPAVTRRMPGATFWFGARAVALAAAVTVACTSASAALPVPDLSLGSATVRFGGTPTTMWPPPTTFRAPSSALDDAIDLPLVRAELTRNQPTIAACLARHRRADTPVAGEIVIHWVIGLDGKAVEECITRDTVGDPDLADCVTELVRASQFPAPRGSAVDVEIPFRFHATKP